MAIQNRRKSIKVLCEGVKVVSAEYTVHKPRLAAQIFLNQFGILPDRIGDRRVVGLCHRTGKVILVGDLYQQTDYKGPRLLKEVNP